VLRIDAARNKEQFYLVPAQLLQNGLHASNAEQNDESLCFCS